MNMIYGMGGIPDIRSMNKRDNGIGGSSIPGLGSILSGNSVNPMSSPDMNPTGLTQMNPSGGAGSMNVLGSLQAHGNFGTQFGRDPVANPFSYGGG